MLKSFCAAAASLALISCTAGGSRTGPAALPGAGSTPPSDGRLGEQLPAAGTYRIDSSSSELRLLVYRAGMLADLGHNHVIINRSVAGSIEVGSAWNDSSLSLRAPVAAFIVDDVQARAEEGKEFQAEISDEARTGTYDNMTGTALLDAIRHPVISARSTRVEQSQGKLAAILTVSVAGRESTISAPFTMSQEPYGVAVTASFELRQSDLGLTPFSLMLGALSVRDEMRVKLKIAAQLETPR